MSEPVPEILRKSMLLSGLSEANRAHVLKDALRRSYGAGETVFLQGEPARAVFIVLSGAVKLVRMTPSGAEAVVAIIGRGRSFAEAMVLRRTPYPVTAEAITACTLLQIDGTRLRQFLVENPEFAIDLLASTFVHLQGLVEQVEKLKAHSGVQRLAEFLAGLAEAEAGACAVELPYSKRLIAGHLGMQPESLSRAFAKLRESGVESEGNRVLIADLEALRAVAAGER
ncbi:cyclic nucleotide-binding domain-containing protein [uncultured Paracoccus sp.]|uniref:Crp/Fnr family transcriptional regulator n=1 Tax=uncultured Paracoccus sp. TaxID=189685 RepID=UPI00262A6AC9|nr:cyclic nucleotide-binding domain-containing protein [uncultured Paracoccus sp.]